MRFTYLILIVAPALLSGCASQNSAGSTVSAAIADTMPVWMGGEPKDVPPRPGTPQYDAWMAERAKAAQQPKTSTPQQ